MRFDFKAKIGASFALIVLMTCGVGFVGLQALGGAKTALEDLVADPVKQTERLMTVRAYISDVGRLANTLDTVTDPAVFSDLAQTAVERGEKASALLADYRAAAAPEDRAALDGLEADAKRYAEVAGEVIALLAKVNADPADAAQNADKAHDLSNAGMRPLMSSMVDALGEARDRQDARTAAVLSANEASFQRTRTLFLGTLAFAVVFAIAAAFWIGGQLSSRLARSVALARRIGEGDLTAQVDTASRDEVGDLQRAMGDMSAKLREIVLVIMSSASNVSSGSAQSAATADQLSSGSTEQAAASEQASAAVEEMTANVRQNADNASQTEKMAEQASRNAAKTGIAVAASVEAMRTITTKTSVVREIARQTDLLALNAAIEAARAGQHGKGFAVVASEVRKLAERSATAASEIGQLSEETLVTSEDAGRMLSMLVPDIQRTAELVSEISAACREQSVGIDQINQAIQQLDQVTQANAGAASQMSATATQLSAEAGQLEKSAAFFQLSSAGAPRPVAAAPSRRDSVAALQAKVKALGQTHRKPEARGPAKVPSAAAAGFDMDLGGDKGFERMSA